MKLEVKRIQDNYVASIWDGPDGIDEQTFIDESLRGLFKKIFEWRRTNALSYLD